MTSSKKHFIDAVKYIENFYTAVGSRKVMGVNIFQRDIYYGIIDDKNNIVYPSETNLKALSANNEVLAIDFVADAFEDFQNDIYLALDNGTIRQPSFLRNMEPTKGWESTLGLYNDHMGNIYEDFVGGYLSENSRHATVRNFADFIDHFIRYVKINVDKNPISLSRFIVSTKCTRRISGLILEVLDADYNNKQFSADKVLNDPYFNMYLNTAAKYGFKIDVGVPWRLVADIRTPEMIAYMNKPPADPDYASYGITNIEQLFRVYYYKCYRKDILFLKKYLISFYNNFASAMPFSKHVCTGASKVHTEIIRRHVIEEADIDSEYNNASWALMYFKLRILEENINVTPEQVSQIKTKIIRINRSSSFEQVAAYIKNTIVRLSLDQVA